MIDKNLSRTEKQILSVLMTSDSPKTIRQIAEEMKVHYQTVANYVPKLLQKNHIEESGKIRNAMTYVIGDPAGNLVGIMWHEEHVTIATLLSEIVDGNSKTPVGRLNPFAREILHYLSLMYKMSADAIDDDNPRPITIATLKNIQSKLASRRRLIRNLMDTYDSLINNDALFNPKQIVQELIIKDAETDVTRARSIFEGIQRELGNEQ